MTAAYQAKNEYRQAFDYQQLMRKAQDSLFSQQKALQIHNVEYNEQQRQEEIKTAEINYQNRIRYSILFAIIVLVLLIAVFLFYISRSRKIANAILQ